MTGMRFGRFSEVCRECLKIRKDFENALLYYSSAGLSLDDALDRLSVSNLGGFYARPPVLWYKLDDAAKIFPLSMRHGCPFPFS